MVFALAAQLGTLAGMAQSERARERANPNARFNRAGGRALSDNEFLTDAYGRGLAEIRMAHMAVETSRDPDIQKIGHRIINEQQRANDDLKRLAQARNVTLPTDLAQRDQDTADRLAKLQGGEFDRAYRDHLNTDYRDTVKVFEDASRNAKDAEVRSTASQYATLLQQHAQTIGITGLGSTSGAAAVDRPNDPNYSRERGYVREREGTGALNSTDTDLLKKLHQSSITEVEAARVALKNSKDNKIRTLAQTILTDHQNMNRDIEDVASRRGAPLSKGTLEVQQKLIERLSNSTGNDFDKDYHNFLMAGHRTMLKELDNAAASNDPDLRSLAARYRSGIQDHLRSVQTTGEGSSR